MSEIIKANDNSLIEDVVDYSVEIANLSDSDKKQYLSLTTQIDTNNPRSISSFGYDINKSLADQADVLLDKSASNKVNEINALTNQLLSEIQDIDISDDEEPKRYAWVKNLPVVRKFVKTANDIRIKSHTPRENVDEIAKKIESVKMLAMKETQFLEEMKKNVGVFKKKNHDRIIALMLLQENIEDELSGLKSKGNLQNPYEIRNKQLILNAISRRITDMEMIDVVLKNNMGQIEAAEGNYDSIVHNAETIIGQVIPIWKSQLFIGNVQNNQKMCAEMEKKVRERANEMLAKNADMLEKNSIEIATLNESTIFEIDTLKNTTESMISIIKTVNNIHMKGEENRANIRKELGNLKVKLINSIGENLLPNDTSY